MAAVPLIMITTIPYLFLFFDSSSGADHHHCPFQQSAALCLPAKTMDLLLGSTTSLLIYKSREVDLANPTKENTTTALQRFTVFDRARDRQKAREIPLSLFMNLTTQNETDPFAYCEQDLFQPRRRPWYVGDLSIISLRLPGYEPENIPTLTHEEVVESYLEGPVKILAIVVLILWFAIFGGFH